MTEAERLLWSKIIRKRLKGIQFYRQKITGNYIADFYCPELKLVIEIDGGQHDSAEGMENDHNERYLYDSSRDNRYNIFR